MECVAKPIEIFTAKQNCARLIKLIAAGDRSAFTQLYENTSGLVFGLLLRILNHSKAAEEVCEQVYAEIWTQADNFDEEQEKSLIWLITIVHRRGFERLSKKANKEFGAICENNIDDCAPNNFNLDRNIREHWKLANSAVNALSPAQLEMLELAYFSGMKQTEIADYLGQPVETSQLSLKLAIKKLSTLFSFLNSQPRWGI